MTAPVLTYVSVSSPAPRFQELDRVRLLRDMTTDEMAIVLAGTMGTIVGAWPEGQAFELEFRNVDGLVTAGIEDIEQARG